MARRQEGKYIDILVTRLDGCAWESGTLFQIGFLGVEVTRQRQGHSVRVPAIMYTRLKMRWLVNVTYVVSYKTREVVDLMGVVDSSGSISPES